MKKWIAGLTGGGLVSLLAFLLPIVLVVSVLGNVIIGKANDNYNADPDAGSFASKFIAMLISQDGTAATGAERKSEYAIAYGNYQPFAPWGAYFISWCARRAEVPMEMIPDASEPTPEAFEWTLTLVNTTPLSLTSGDILFFDFDQNGVSDAMGVTVYTAGQTAVIVAGDVNGQYLPMCNPSDGELKSNPHATSNTMVTGLKLDFDDPEQTKYVLGYHHTFSTNAMGQYGISSFGGMSMVDVVKRESVSGDINGGEKYWRWWGFTSRQPWCAIFMSWCADQCGFLSSGACPKFAAVGDGITWFKSKDEWKERGYTPTPGDYVFYDWDHDGLPDHVECVVAAQGATFTSIGGNTGESPGIIGQHQNRSINSPDVYGFGTPNYTIVLWPAPGCYNVKAMQNHNTRIYIGMDGNNLGFPVVAAAAGKVVDVQTSTLPNGNTSNTIHIDHSDTPGLEGFQTTYSSTVAPSVSAGDTVAAGQQIASMSETGFAFTVQNNGTWVNPFTGEDRDGNAVAKPFLSTDGLTLP